MRLCEKCYTLKDDPLFKKIKGFNQAAPTLGLKWCYYCQRDFLKELRGKNKPRLFVNRETITVNFD